MKITPSKYNQLTKEQQQRLIEIAVEHSALAAEASKRTTSAQRKKDITSMIEVLRVERDVILGELDLPF